MVGSVIHSPSPILHGQTTGIRFPLSRSSRGLTGSLVRCLIIDRSPRLYRGCGLQTNIKLTTPRINRSGRVTTILIPNRRPSSGPIFGSIVVGPMVVDRSIRCNTLARNRNYLSISHSIPNCMPHRSQVALGCRSAANRARAVQLGRCPTVIYRRRVSRLRKILFCSRVGGRRPFRTPGSAVLFS